MRWGTEDEAEHGPGAAQAIGSLRRGRPLKRRSMLVLPEAGCREASAKQGGNTDFPSLCVYAQGRFFFRRDHIESNY